MQQIGEAQPFYCDKVTEIRDETKSVPYFYVSKIQIYFLKKEQELENASVLFLSLVHPIILIILLSYMTSLGVQLLSQGHRKSFLAWQRNTASLSQMKLV